MDLYTQIIESNKTLRHLSKHFMLLQSNNLGRKILNLDSVASMTFLLIKPLIQHPLKFVLYNDEGSSDQIFWPVFSLISSFQLS